MSKIFIAIRTYLCIIVGTFYTHKLENNNDFINWHRKFYVWVSASLRDETMA